MIPDCDGRSDGRTVSQTESIMAKTALCIASCADALSKMEHSDNTFGSSVNPAMDIRPLLPACLKSKDVYDQHFRYECTPIKSYLLSYLDKEEKDEENEQVVDDTQGSDNDIDDLENKATNLEQMRCIVGFRQFCRDVPNDTRQRCVLHSDTKFHESDGYYINCMSSTHSPAADC